MVNADLVNADLATADHVASSSRFKLIFSSIALAPNI